MRRFIAAVALVATASCLSHSVLAGDVRAMTDQQMTAAVGGSVPGCLFTGYMCSGSFPANGCTFGTDTGLCTGQIVVQSLTPDYNRSCLSTPVTGRCSSMLWYCVTWQQWDCTVNPATGRTCTTGKYRGTMSSGTKIIAQGSAGPC